MKKRVVFFLCSLFFFVPVSIFCSQKKELISYVAYRWFKNGSDSFIAYAEDFRLSAWGSRVKIEMPFDCTAFDDKNIDSLLNGICLHGGLIVTRCRETHNNIDSLSKLFARVFCKGGEPAGAQIFALYSDGSWRYRYSNRPDNNFVQECRELITKLPALCDACLEWKEQRRKEKLSKVFLGRVVTFEKN